MVAGDRLKQHFGLLDANCETKVVTDLLETLRVQSSAKRRSLITVSLTLVTACICLGLNSLPSDLYLMWMAGSLSLMASVSIAENIMHNSLGARIKPYLIPDAFPLSSTQAILPKDRDKLIRATKLSHDLLEPPSTNRVKRFG